MELLSVITAIIVGGIAGYVGSLMLTRRMALVAGPLGHLALPGVALALIYNFQIFFGALASILIGALIIWLFSLRTKVSLEALTAIIFASGVALGFLVLPIEHAEEALIGDITKVTLFDAILAVTLSLAIFTTLRRMYSQIVLMEISEELAKSLKIDVRKYNLIYLLCVATVAAMEVKIVGILLTAALTAIPAATSRNICNNLKTYAFASSILGAISAILGVFLASLTKLPAGPVIILTAFSFFIISTIIKDLIR